MDDAERIEALKRYIRVDLIGRADLAIEADTPLVSSGLIDSMALIDVLMKLEDLTGRDIPAGKVQPHHLDTITSMLAVAARLGRPRS
jgi:acyl carrier protein